MPPSTKTQLLDDLAKRKRNRRVAEVEEVLQAFGWSRRPTTKEGNLWVGARRTLTLPRPHGGDTVLKTPYVALVVRILQTQLEEEEERDV